MRQKLALARPKTMSIAEGMDRDSDVLALRNLSSVCDRVENLPNGVYTVFSAYPDHSSSQLLVRREDDKKEISDEINICFVLQRAGTAANGYAVLVERLDFAAIDLLSGIVNRRVEVKNVNGQAATDNWTDRSALYNRLAKRNTKSERRRIWLFRHLGMDDLNELQAGRDYRIDGVSLLNRGIVSVGLTALGTAGAELGRTTLFMHFPGAEAITKDMMGLFAARLNSSIRPKTQVPRLMFLPTIELLQEAFEFNGFSPLENYALRQETQRP